jgi:DNA-binding transcriptional ArsR family regulator
MNDTDSSAFDASRAELFEALSHPLRVRILHVLGERSQRFSELKHTLGLESSGHLSFHLEKLGNLVKTTLDGDYELSDEGTEALRLFMTLNQVTESPSVHVALKDSLFNRKIVTVSLVLILIAGVLISSSSFRSLQDQISVLTNENAELNNENAELQECLNTLPVIQPFIQIGRDYLDGLGMTTGKILSIQLMEKAPIYWHNYTDIDIARAKETGEILPPYVLGEPRLCWVIRFEKADRPGHFEVWIDANTTQIIGMAATCSC